MATSRLRPIVVAWLLAGSMDISAAILVYARSAARAKRLLQSIASGLLGAQAFSGGLRTATLGLVLHYLIALVWTVVGAFLLMMFRGLRRHLVAAGLAYGVVVWLVMNLIVLPLSHANHNPIHFVPAATGAAILMVCIGLPIALVLGRR